ncbi:hypothetical protein OG500_20735 [Kitasatospora sp. NBC_01250]|uniref:hypothetical protein n=1 Tax=Kitasatospora sp. NBC_01250 TaxID=2903571 RepID=UPI002E34B0E8|nr:hypothetical protein [Kitasatospora sp. NBC_01250]
MAEPGDLSGPPPTPVPTALEPALSTPAAVPDAQPDDALPDDALPDDALPDDAQPDATRPDEEPAARRPRTALLLVGALLLGPLLGAGIGYAVQQHRPPTPLPALLPAAAPAYPAAHLDAQDSAAIAPRPLAIDGDLRPLLLPRPDGAQDWDDFGLADSGDWESISQIAMETGHSADNFTQLATNGFRRAAVTSWQKDGVKYRVQLVQYFSDNSYSALAAMSSMRFTGTPFGGGMAGAYAAPATQETYADTTESFYHGRALTRRGDVVVDVEAFGTAQVSADVVRDLAKQQWERLA